MSYVDRSLIPLVAVLAVMACGDDSTTNPGSDEAIVEGRVEQTVPQAAPSAMAGRPVLASAQARTVAVVQYGASGAMSALAEADVEADGSFRVEGVPPNRTDLGVVAYSGAEIVGQVLVHEGTRAGEVIVAGPIDYETTIEGRAYGRVKAKGAARASSDAELALLVHMNGSDAEAVLASNAELDAMANGFMTAMATFDAVYAEVGESLDASVRAEALADAAADFASDRNLGVSASEAHEAFLEAALDAFVDAGATEESNVLAAAAAASTFDAELNGSSSVRGSVVVETVRLNLRARERLATELDGSSEASLAASIRTVLASTGDDLDGATTAAEIRAAIDAEISAMANVVASGVVELLVPGASVIIQDQVRVLAGVALQTASLDARLQTAAGAQAAAEAVASYRAEVRSAVQAILQASGDAEMDVEAMTSLFIAAGGCAHVR